MTLAPALNNTQLERARGTDDLASRFVSRVRISVNPNTVIYSARVNQASFDNSFAQITYDGGSGTLADVRPGMTVLISRTSDKSKAYFRGRVRAVPTSSILYVNENSYDIQDNDYLWVIEDYAITDKLAREVSGVQLNDYAIPFRQLLPIVYNLNPVYAGDVDPDTGEFELSLNPSLLVTESGATAGTLTWVVGSGVTYLSGNSHTAAVTLSIPEGHRYIHLSWPDSNGNTAVRHIEIHAHGDSYTYQLMAVENLSFTHAVGTGRDGSLTNYEAPSGLLDLTQITVWSDDSDQVDDGSISGSNIIFFGRIRTRTNESAASEAYGIEKGAQYTLEGPLTQLARTEQRPYEMLDVASPTKFGEIKDMTLYRGIAYLLSEYSTFLEIHSLSFDAFDNTFIAPTRNPSGDILTACNDLALSIGAALEIDGAGNVEVVRNGVMLETTSQRNALPTRANVTISDLISISLKQDGARTVGRLTASGGSYNTTTGQYTVSESVAPGTAQDSGSETRTLDRQVFAVNLSQAGLDADLKTRANHALEKAQPVDTITATFTPSWHSLLIPSLKTWWTFTLDADITVDGEVVGKTTLTNATRWQLVSADLAYNADGIPEVKGSFVKETIGITKGLTVVYPPGQQSTLSTVPSTPSVPMFQVPPLSLPELPTGNEVPVFPPGAVTTTMPLDGNAWIIGGENDGEQVLLFTTTMLILSAPYTRKITPPLETGEVIKQALFNNVTKGIYCLTYKTDSDESRIWYLGDVSTYAGAGDWTAGESIGGQFTEMRLLKGNGKVAILGAVSGEPAYNVSIQETSGTDLNDLGDGVYEVTPVSGFGSDNGDWGAGILIDGCANLVSFSTDADLAPSGNRGYLLCGDDPADFPPFGLRFGSFGEGQCVSKIFFRQYTNDVITFTLSPDDCSERVTSAVTAYSTDFGATLSTPEAVGTTASWISAQADGTQILVGGGSQTQKAAVGDSFSAYGSAKASAAGFVPRYLLPPGTASNASANPQSVIFADTLDSGESMWMAKSSNSAFTDITPIRSGVEGLSVNTRNITGAWQNSSHILAIALFDTDVRLAISTDGGSSWHFTAPLDDDAFNIVTQKGDRLQRLAGFANGAKVGILRNYQAASPTFTEKTLPLDSISSLDIYG